jgi:hypothetical protein
VKATARNVILSLVLVTVVSVAVTAVLVWRTSRHVEPSHPEISAFTAGQLVRVGPYRFCDVYEITKCDVSGASGELRVTTRDTIQLSVPPRIAEAPWVLLRSFEDGGPAAVEEFRPDTALAATIPTVDARRGKLTGFAVMLPTLVRDEDGNEFPWPHAEWSVSTVWS